MRRCVAIVAGLLPPLMFVVACTSGRIANAQTTSSPRQPRPTPNTSIPNPQSVIGHAVGADYKLARWEKIIEYFEKLAVASERVNVRRLDSTTENNPYILVEISSAENIRQLDRLKTVQARLADPRLIADQPERQRVLANARTTILVSCGLHSSEVAASQMSMELAYDLAAGNDPRTREILDNCVILLVPCTNPDGLNKIVDWYERNLNTPFEGARMPWLYQKYAGHDNNRDWFMLNLKETRTLTRLLYEEWHPTILHDVHQMGNRGARFFVPPFFDPVNPNVDPLIHQSLLIIGGHMATELQENGKTGVVFKAIFDNWWQGGNRTTPYRHNIVGILTEAASAKYASPIFQDYGDLRGGGRGFPQYAPAVNFPEPWPGGWWRLRDVVEYQKIANMALFTLAARYRDRFVQNHLSLSEKSVRLGSEIPPYAWLVPPEQHDPAAMLHMLYILSLSGIEVHTATDPFTADDVPYPANTYVLLAAQPFRSHLKDMMERQVYPERRSYPGGPAESPYDAAGWTLPLQMGVRTVEVISKFDAKLRKLDNVRPMPEGLRTGPAPAGYITRRFGNDDYAVINGLLELGFQAAVLKEEFDGFPVGSVVVTGKPGDAQLSAERLMGELQRRTVPRAARFEPLQTMPATSVLRQMSRPRTALYQPWTASMDEGWTRFVLERFDFPYATIRNAEIRAGRLRERFDCVIVPDLSLDSILNGASDKSMPPPYAGGIGEDGAMQLERFVRAGGTLVLMDSATQLATELLRVPARDVLEGLPRDEFFCPGSLLRIRVDNTHPLGYGFDDEAAAYFSHSQAFEIGEAALRAAKGSRDQEIRGSSDRGNRGSSDQGIRGSRSRGNKGSRSGSESAQRDRQSAGETLSSDQIDARLAEMPVTSVATYSDNVVLLSGWILGDEHIRNRVAVAEVQYGDGRIVLLGFRVQHRAQPWGTFKFLFNAIYSSTLSP